MQERLEERLAELRQELAIGEERLRALDTERERLRDTLLRINGAIVALTELLDEGKVEALRRAPYRGLWI
jgi:hypothetical protein